MKTLLGAAAAAAILAATAVGVSAAAEERQVFIGGAPAVVHARIVHAARLVCEAEYVRGAHTRRDLQECIEATTDDGVIRAGRSDLVAYHEALSAEERYRDRYFTTVASAD